MAVVVGWLRLRWWNEKIGIKYVGLESVQLPAMVMFFFLPFFFQSSLIELLFVCVGSTEDALYMAHIKMVRRGGG